MDTNLGNKLTTTTWGTLLIILFLTIVSVGIYAPIKDYGFKDNIEQYIETDNFVYVLTDITKYLIQSEDRSSYSYHNRYANIKSIKYYITNEEKTLSISNIPDATAYKLQQEVNDSRFYLKAKFDENGNPTLESSQGERFNKDAFISGLLRRSDSGLEALADLEITYAIPRGNALVGHSDIFTYEVKSFSLAHHMILILTIGAISTLLLTIIAFAIPFSSQRKAPVIRLFNRMLLEFKVMLFLGFVLGGIFILRIIETSYSPSLASNYVNIIYDANHYFYLIGIPVTFTLCLLIYLSICYIKYIYHEGFKEGLVKNSFIGKAFYCAVNGIKELTRQIIEIDMTKEYHKKFLMILGINLLILWIVVSLGTLGFILAVVYTIFLFKYFINMLDKVRALNFATKQLAQGNFDIVIEEDLGILSPISNNLNNIKNGFKVAVEKEVKSQNLKSELITNVSHDLKTPLTSIITYVDLLKNEEMANETHREYIDILDKKGQRLKALIDDLFEASKASSGNIELYMEELDVVALLRQTLGELEERIIG